MDMLADHRADGDAGEPPGPQGDEVKIRLRRE
jgi:hypothetical protein